MPNSKPKAPAEPETLNPEKSKADRSKSKQRDVSKEIGGREGLDPVRYGDWEKGGRCIDF